MESTATHHLLRFLGILSNLIKAAIVAVIAWQLSQLIWYISTPDNPVVLSNQKMEQWMLAGAEPLSLDKRFIASNLFTNKSVVAAKPKPVVAPKTALNMVLKAVFVSTDDRPSGAIIAVLGQPTEYFSVGTELQPGIRLVDVLADYVVLERGGERESLFFPKENALAPSALVQNNQALNTLPQREVNQGFQPQVITNKALKSLPKTSLGSDIQRLNPRAFMSKYQVLLEENPQQVLDEAGISVAPSGVGYLIGQSQYSSFLTSAGLKIGDVVLSINGQMLGNTNQDAQLVGSLANQKEVDVEIQRGSRQFMVSVPIGRR